MYVIIILVVLIVLLLLWGFSTYNALVRLRNNAEASWAQIDVVLKRRSDLIPNLVETVKGFAKHESETLENVIKARNSYNSASTIDESIESSNQLTQALGRLFAVAEAYPELKANTNFLQLQSELTETEDKIQYARQFYNDDVTQYKNKIEMFPSNIIANMSNFKAMPFFTVSEKDKEVPHVQF